MGNCVKSRILFDWVYATLLTNEQSILLGNAIKAFRTARNLTQRDLARAGTISFNQVYLLEAGKAPNVRQLTLSTISNAMQLTDGEAAHLMRIAGFDTANADYVALSTDESKLIEQLRELGPDVAAVIYDSVEGMVLNRNARRS